VERALAGAPSRLESRPWPGPRLIPHPGRDLVPFRPPAHPAVDPAAGRSSRSGTARNERNRPHDLDHVAAGVPPHEIDRALDGNEIESRLCGSLRF